MYHDGAKKNAFSVFAEKNDFFLLKLDYVVHICKLEKKIKKKEYRSMNIWKWQFDFKKQATTLATSK